MKLILVALLVFLAVVYVQSDIESSLDSTWSGFKKRFNKTYETPEEEDRRKAIFAERLEIVEEHNKKFKAGDVTYTLGINQYADLTQEEWKKVNTGFIPLAGEK